LLREREEVGTNSVTTQDDLRFRGRFRARSFLASACLGRVCNYASHLDVFFHRFKNYSQSKKNTYVCTARMGILPADVECGYPWIRIDNSYTNSSS
jgi:hypothetical protein